MKTKILKEFRDKYNLPLFYRVGMLIEFSTERAKELKAKGLVEIVEEDEEDPKPSEDVKESDGEKKEDQTEDVKENPEPTPEEDVKPSEDVKEVVKEVAKPKAKSDTKKKK